MSIQPGASPFSAAGSRVGVLLCHGFTGSPASMRPWADQLAESGLSVELPLLPGHGTTWQDMQKTRWPDWYGTVDQAFMRLSARCDHVFVAGLSMGGTLALRLAEQHGEKVAGVMVVNPSVHSRNRMFVLLPLLRHVLAAVPGVRNDIKREGYDEIAYPKVPLQALHSLTQFWKTVADDLPKVRQPLLVFASTVDHVVEPSNAREVMEAVSSEDATYEALANSYHVATLDNDAQRIFDESQAFIARVIATLKFPTPTPSSTPDGRNA